MHHHDSNDSFLIRIELEEPAPGYLAFTFLRDRRGSDFLIMLAKCENREELNRDALIDTIADAYLEQPGEAARLGRHTVSLPLWNAYNARISYKRNERTTRSARFMSDA
jgi:hypothetical protein